MKLKTNNFTIQHVVYCCCHSNRYNCFSNIFLLFLKVSHVDLYLEKFSSIYLIGQNSIIREPIPFDLYAKVFSL